MTVNATANLEVEIDESEQKEITLNYLAKVFDIQYNCFIRKGKLIHWWETSMGQHHSTEEKVIRKATNSDILYFKVVDHINTSFSEDEE